jgi:hypothetical protein
MRVLRGALSVSADRADILSDIEDKRSSFCALRIAIIS